MDVTQAPSPCQARRWVRPSAVALPVFEIMRLVPIVVKRTAMRAQDTSGLRAPRLQWARLLDNLPGVSHFCRCAPDVSAVKNMG